MKTLDYHIQLEVSISAEKAIETISKVQGWWAQEIEGSATKEGDQFTVHFGKTWGTFKVLEINGHQIVWGVVDSYLDLLKNSKEWNDTRLIFQFKHKNDQTVIDITHQGLTPDKECFSDCTNGWNYYFGESLLSYLEKQKGMPGLGIHAWLKANGEVYKGKLYTRDQVSAEMSGDLLLLDVKQTKVEQVVSAYSVRSFVGDVGTLQGDYYMLLSNDSQLLDTLQNFVSESQ